MRKKKNSFIITNIRDTNARDTFSKDDRETKKTKIPPGLEEGSEEQKYSSSESLVSNTVSEEKPYNTHYLKPSLGSRRNVKSLPMLNCTSPPPRPKSQGQPSPGPTRPDRKSEPIQTPTAIKPETESKHKTLTELNKGLGSIFYNSNLPGAGLIPINSGTPPNNKSPAVVRRSNLENGVEKSSPVLRRATVAALGEKSSPVLRRAKVEEVVQKSSPVLRRAKAEEVVKKPSPVLRRANVEEHNRVRSRHNSEFLDEYSDYGRPLSRRSNMEDAREAVSRPASRRSNAATDESFEPGFIARSPASLRRSDKSNNRRYDDTASEAVQRKSLLAKVGRVGRGMVRSLSRQSLYEESAPEELEVYHTITGGRSNLLAASRAAFPFAKITRRPARLVAGIPSMVDEDDDDTESIFSLNEDMWRVRDES